MSAKDLTNQEIENLDWYYTVELRKDIFTKGSHFINMIPVRKLLGRIDFTDLEVLDIGTMEGANSVLLDRAGAKVVAYDRIDLRDRVSIVQEVYRTNFDYQFSGPFHQYATKLRSERRRGFDCVLLSGVIYHAIDPGIFLHLASTLLRPGGILILETACAIDHDAALYFNRAGRFNDFTNYYQPSTGWLDYFLRVLGFRIVDVEFVIPKFPARDGRQISRVAMICILGEPSRLEFDDEWGKLKLTMRELEEFGTRDYRDPVDLTSRLRTDNYIRELYYRKGAENSLRLTNVLYNKAALVRDQSKCVLRLDDNIQILASVV